MTSDLQNLIELQQIDSQIAALKAGIAALPKHVAEIEAKLAGSKAKVEATLAAAKADEGARRPGDGFVRAGFDQQVGAGKGEGQQPVADEGACEDGAFRHGACGGQGRTVGCGN